MEFLCRACLAALFAIAAHMLPWEWLRFLTSEAVIRLSALIGMTTARISFDTIELQGEFFQYFVSCTFAEVFAGCLPAIWRKELPLLRNLSRVVLAEGALFGFNILRLEAGQILYSHGVPWLLAHDILLGFAYFAVVVTIWRNKDWAAWQYHALSARIGSPPSQAIPTTSSYPNRFQIRPR